MHRPLRITENAAMAAAPRTAGRLICAAIAAVAAAACADRAEPLAPGLAAPVSVTAGSAALVADAAASPAIAIDDALVRVIPSFGKGAATLHDAFDLVADALEVGDRKLGDRVDEAREALTNFAAASPAEWSADVEALRLALEAVSAGTSGGGGKKR